HLLPTIWFRNTWSWDRAQPKPTLRKTAHHGHAAVIKASHPALGDYDLFCDSPDDLFFTENESNLERLWGVPNATPFVKDSINDCVVGGKIDIVIRRNVEFVMGGRFRSKFRRIDDVDL